MRSPLVEDFIDGFRNRDRDSAFCHPRHVDVGARQQSIDRLGALRLAEVLGIIFRSELNHERPEKNKSALPGLIRSKGREHDLCFRVTYRHSDRLSKPPSFKCKTKTSCLTLKLNAGYQAESKLNEKDSAL